MNTLRFETFSPIRRREGVNPLAAARKAHEREMERRKEMRSEKARRCGRVAA